MMNIAVIPDSEFNRIAKAFSDKRRLRRLTAASLNEGGSKLRRDLVPLVQEELVDTSKSVLAQKSVAASTRRSGPLAYRTSISGAVPVSKLRAPRRRLRGRKLVISHPDGAKLEFKSVEKVGKGYRLNRAGPLAERSLGPIRFSHRYRESRPINRRLLRAGDDVAAELARQIEAYFRGK